MKKSTITIRIVTSGSGEVTSESRHHTQQGATDGLLKADKIMDQCAMGAGYERLEIEVDGVILGGADMADVHAAMAMGRGSIFPHDALKSLFHDFLSGARKPSTAGILDAA